MINQTEQLSLLHIKYTFVTLLVMWIFVYIVFNEAFCIPAKLILSGSLVFLTSPKCLMVMRS